MGMAGLERCALGSVVVDVGDGRGALAAVDLAVRVPLQEEGELLLGGRLATRELPALERVPHGDAHLGHGDRRGGRAGGRRGVLVGIDLHRQRARGSADQDKWFEGGRGGGWGGEEGKGGEEGRRGR